MVAIGIIGLYYQRQQVRLMKPDAIKKFHHWPLIFMITLAASSWIPYVLLPDDLPEWPDPKPYVVQYGVGQNDCLVVVNGDRFLKYRAHYRLASACYIYDGIGDLLDVPQLQTSKAYDIRVGAMALRAVWGASFPKYLSEKGPILSMNHVVLMLPIGVVPGEFSTLREAKAMGVKIVNGGSNSMSVLPQPR